MNLGYQCALVMMAQRISRFARNPDRLHCRLPSGDVAGNSKGYYQFLVYSDVIVTIIFTFEMAFKIIGLGFVGWEKTEIRFGKFYFCIPGFGGADGKHTYLRNPWNALIS